MCRRWTFSLLTNCRASTSLPSNSSNRRSFPAGRFSRPTTRHATYRVRPSRIFPSNTTTGLFNPRSRTFSIISSIWSCSIRGSSFENGWNSSVPPYWAAKSPSDATEPSADTAVIMKHLRLVTPARALLRRRTRSSLSRPAVLHQGCRVFWTTARLGLCGLEIYSRDLR
jgi:hypothetical protein